MTGTMREPTPTLTPTLSLTEGEGAISVPSPPEGPPEAIRSDPRVLEAYLGGADE
jgi:hypothetical protein